MSTSLDSTQVAPSVVASLFDRMDLDTARAIGQRFALAIRLSILGAWHASGESGTAYREDDLVVVYSMSPTEADAREEFADWGTIVEVAALAHLSDVIEPSDALCHGCWRPAHEVGVLTTCVIKVKRGVVPVRYCDTCIGDHLRVETAINDVREFQRRSAHSTSDVRAV